MDWYVTHAPQYLAKRLKEIEAKIMALSKGHEGQTSSQGCDPITNLNADQDKVKRSNKRHGYRGRRY